MLTEWSGAAVEPGGGKPTPTEWESVSVPGRPDAFAGADCVAYRTTFADPRDPEEAMASLTLRGCYAHARVWLNDDLVAESDAYFEPIRVPFEPAGENELVVECRAPEDRFGGIHATDRVPDGDAVPGIWWGVDLSTHPESFVLDVSVTPTLESGDEATLDAAVEVYAGESLDDRLTLTTRPAGERRGRGMMDRASVSAMAGERVTVEKAIALRDPSLWWPADVGPQNRYEVRAKLGDDVTTTTTGVAAIRSDGDGVSVNGQRVPVRGVTVQDGTEADVERAREVNANLLRAHAHALPESVYEACDEAGVLVWQDLPLTGPGIFDISRGEDLAARLVGTYDHHPSLAAFGVHDEPTATFADRLGSGVLDRLRFRWRTWRADYDRGPAETVADAFPDDRPVYPVVGEPGTDPDAAALYPGWDYGTADDLGWILDRFPHLGDAVGEFGAGSLGAEDPDELAGFDRAKHDAVVPGDGVDASQAHQADVVGSVAETLRVEGGPVVVANALRDTAGAGMGVFASDGTEKAAAGALASAFEPVQALLADSTSGESDVVVVNDSAEQVSGTLSWTAGDTGGETDVSVPATDSAVVTTISVSDGTEDVELTLSTEEGTVTNAYSF
ncbi:MAG: hydrolase [Haloarculaceae archaeon]